MTPGFHWNYLFYYRVKTNVLDSLAIGADGDGGDGGIGARQLVDVCNQTANVGLETVVHARDPSPLSARRQ